MSTLDRFAEYKKQCEKLVADGMYEEAMICAHEMLDVFEDNDLDEDLENIFIGHTHIVYNVESSIIYMSYLERLIAIYKKSGMHFLSKLMLCMSLDTLMQRGMSTKRRN